MIIILTYTIDNTGRVKYNIKRIKKLCVKIKVKKMYSVLKTLVLFPPNMLFCHVPLFLRTAHFYFINIWLTYFPGINFLSLSNCINIIMCLKVLETKFDQCI